MGKLIFNPRWDDLPHGCKVETLPGDEFKTLTIKGEVIGKEFSKIAKREYYDSQGRLNDYLDPATNNIYPARLYKEGSYNSFKNNLLHADNRPAIYWKFATGEHIEFRKDGLLHRENGPAKISNSEISFYIDGDCKQSHFPDGRIAFYENGKLVHQTIRVGNRGTTLPEFADAPKINDNHKTQQQPSL